jgi:hypothetical protein
MNTSKKEKEVSDAELDERPSDTVYDFLYHDARRVGSFLAQFDDSGHLQKLTQSESVRGRGRRGYEISAGVAAVGSLGLKRPSEETGGEDSERVYDPFWTNALTFLDFLEDRELIIRDISQTRIGKIVEITGRLTVLDFSLMKSAWDVPSIKKIVKASEGNQTPAVSRQQRRHTERQQQIPTTQDVSPVELGFDMIRILPHPMQARMDGANFTAWCSLRDEALVVSSADLLLKHGIGISGEWKIVGILDAMPEPSITVDPLDPMSAFTPAIEADPMLNPIGTMLQQLSNLARAFLGRPPSAYGITPLLIFRSINAGSH